MDSIRIWYCRVTYCAHKFSAQGCKRFFAGAVSSLESRLTLSRGRNREGRMTSGGDALAEKWKLEAEARAYVEEKQLQPLVGDLMASLVRLRSLATPSTI